MKHSTLLLFLCVLVAACFENAMSLDADTTGETDSSDAGTAGSSSDGSATTTPAGSGSVSSSATSGEGDDTPATTDASDTSGEGDDTTTTTEDDDSTEGSSSGGLEAPDGMALIEGATFVMGCDIEVEMAACEADEFPVHDVTLSTFAIDVYEVTVAEYEACVTEGSCTARLTGTNVTTCTHPLLVEDADKPANCITWQQAHDYCAWVDKRLPTESEWEYAAEGPEGLRWPWGDDPLPSCDHAVITACGTYTQPVGSKPMGATESGVEDLVGNTGEWVQDYYSDTAYTDNAAVDPTGPATGLYRVFRGSSFQTGAVNTLRIRNRLYTIHDGSYPHVGFRCAVTL